MACKWNDEMLERMHLVITSLHRRRDLSQQLHWRGQCRRRKVPQLLRPWSFQYFHPAGGSEARMEHGSLRRLLRPRERCVKGLKYWAHTARIFEFRKSSTKFLHIYWR